MYIYIYIYIHTHVVYMSARYSCSMATNFASVTNSEIPVAGIQTSTGVCEKNTPPEKNTLGKTGFQSIKSGGGEQLTLLCYVHGQGSSTRSVFSSDTGGGPLAEKFGELSRVSSSPSSREFTRGVQ